MNDNFDGLFATYKSKLEPNRSNPKFANADRVDSSLGIDDDHERPYRIKFEDITQENHPWGAIASVFRTGENVKQQRRRESHFGDVSLVLRHIVLKSDNNGRVESQLEIQSNTLRNAFINIATGLVNINLHQDPIIIRDPYVEIYHCEERIQQAIHSETDESLRSEIRLLQKFREDYMARTVNDLKALEPNGLITFQLLPFIFAPGHPVLLTNRYLSHIPTYWTAVLHSCHVASDSKMEVNHTAELRLKYTGFNGTVFGSVDTVMPLSPFSGTRTITELPIYPIKYHPDAYQLLKSLRVRGSEFSRLCSGGFKAPLIQQNSGSHIYYNGPFWELFNQDSGRRPGNFRSPRAAYPAPAPIPGPPPEDTTALLSTFLGPPTSESAGRVIIDSPQFLEEFPEYRDETRRQQPASWPPKIPRLRPMVNPNVPLLPKDDLTSTGFTGIAFEKLTEMDLACLPPIIPGFTLTKRVWGFFLVSHVGKIRWNEQAYDSLHLESQRKDAVLRLVREHRLGKSLFDAVVVGKGRGLVFLLHGPPGSGKTMTAEVVAESLQCAVYYTSGGELGLEMWEIESNLRLIFKRMQRWGPVLLFDEADTFMAQRSRDSIERNALVSILLRMLEYQSGILFLTTNRIADFDSAFFSRIHVRLEFEKPQTPQRTLIWTKLAERDGHTISQEEFAKLGNLPMDGRRIKNVLRLASLLCRSRHAAEKTTLEDVKEALRISAGDPNDADTEQAIQEFCG
ncbi:AAA family ATPase [Colletotrichum asianum]|uniref:AAA family ATPase n=1 Tax=Colletotrichum asianum TaxID=702518 RepID=A0A8H3WUJ8_9PEZI|nr:AAA family ATPase [Colletotrichum asianum]